MRLRVTLIEVGVAISIIGALATLAGPQGWLVTVGLTAIVAGAVLALGAWVADVVRAARRQSPPTKPPRGGRSS